MAVRASVTAISGSGCIWMPGLVSDSTCMPTPYVSISGSLNSVKSASRRCQPATTSDFTGTRLSGEPSVASLPYQKASSRATSFT